MNQRIENALQKAGMKKWQLADLLGIHRSTLASKMHYELPEDEQIRIVKLIENAAVNGNAG